MPDKPNHRSDSHEGASSGRGALTGAGQPTPRSARLATFRPSPTTAGRSSTERSGAARPSYGAEPSRGGSSGPHAARRPHRPDERGRATAPYPTEVPERPRTSQPRTSRRSRAPRPSSAPRTQGIAGILASGIAALITVIVAIVGAVVQAISGLFSALFSRNGHMAFARRGSAIARRGSMGRRSSPPSLRSSSSAARRAAWGRRDSQALVRPRAVVGPVCGGLACLLLLSTIFFVPAAGADVDAETKLFDLAPRSTGEIPCSTPREQWQQGSMPYLFQIDPAWAQKPYAGGTVALNGCGPTCLTMIYVYVTGNTDMSPADMCALADKGNYAPTGATEWRFMVDGASELGFTGTQIQVTRDAVTKALTAGKPVACAMQPGDFTATGHFIVLSGIDDNGMVTVHDPNSSLRSAQKWDIDRVLSQAHACWAFS